MVYDNINTFVILVPVCTWLLNATLKNSCKFTEICKMKKGV
jgi:hypothetical protein